MPRTKKQRTLSNPNKRLAPLTAAQHEEIERLIRSSMDSKAKSPTPALTASGRMVVRREVTTLARVAGVRRLQGHAVTFRRALTALERKIAAGTAVDVRTGRLAIEHLWRWLHGYVRPVESDQPRDGVAPSPLQAGDNFDVVSEGMMMIEMPCDLPTENLRAGDMIMIGKGRPIPDGAFGFVRVVGQYILGHIFQLDPGNIRVGKAPGHVYPASDVEMIGPVISGSCKFFPIDQLQANAALAMIESVATLPPVDEDWPDVIGD